MSIFPSKFKTRIAANQRTKVNLNSNHIGTIDFGHLRPTFCMEVVPGDDININMEGFARLMPLAYPTFGGANFYHRAFFIPNRVCYKGWTDFISNNRTYLAKAQQSNSVPYFTNSGIVRAFINRASGVENLASNVTETGSTDFTLQVSGVTTNYQFTNAGKRVYSILLGLGYSINWSLDDNTSFSVLPLLAYFRCLYDYVLNPKFIADYDSLFKGLFEISGHTIWNTNYNSADSLQKLLVDLANHSLALFDNDYFTSAYLDAALAGTQQMPGSSPSFSAISLGGNLENYNAVFNHKVGTTLHRNDSTDLGSNPGINSFALELLQGLHSFVTRNNLVGSRYVDQLLARFGVRPSDEVSGRSSYLGSCVHAIQISDVMATANGSNDFGDSVVGDLAGKGTSYGSNNFRCNVKEHGFIIVMSSVLPSAHYYQGRKRHTLHLNQFDFYTPEFDCKGMQAIRNDELFATYESSTDYSAGQNHGGKPDGIFGYCPRYSEYKVGNMDTLSGDFRIKSLNANMNALHMFRMFHIPDQGNPLGNNSNFQTISKFEQYNYDRIFVTQSTVASPIDHFIFNLNFAVKAYRKMKSISESLCDEGEGDIIEVNPNGLMA